MLTTEQLAEMCHEAERVLVQHTTGRTIMPWNHLSTVDKDAVQVDVIAALMGAANYGSWEPAYILRVNIVNAMIIGRLCKSLLPEWLTPELERELKIRMHIDPDKPFDPSAPIPVAGKPSDAVGTTHEEVLAALGAGATSTELAELETSDVKGNKPAEDVEAGASAQADSHGAQAGGGKGKGRHKQKPVT